MKNRDDLITKVSAIIEMGNKVLGTETKGFQQRTFVDEQQFHDFRISGLSFLSRVFGNSSQHYQCFKTEVTSPGISRAKRGIGILAAAKKELYGGWVESTRGAITSEILSDFMVLAKNYAEDDNLQAATLLIGAVIEKHLRNLCHANEISIVNDRQNQPAAKKPLQLTGDAYKKKLIDRQANRDIISWLELCHSAAQNHAADISAKQVKSMHTGVCRFLVSKPY